MDQTIDESEPGTNRYSVGLTLRFQPRLNKVQKKYLQIMKDKSLHRRSIKHVTSTVSAQLVANQSPTKEWPDDTYDLPPAMKHRSFSKDSYAMTKPQTVSRLV